jgi:hypothetical protein
MKWRFVRSRTFARDARCERDNTATRFPDGMGASTYGEWLMHFPQFP